MGNVAMTDDNRREQLDQRGAERRPLAKPLFSAKLPDFSGMIATDRMAEISRSISENSPGAKLRKMESVSDNSLASEFCKRLTEYCTKFDRQLDSEHEVGVRLVSYGQTVMLYVENIGYYNPSLIHFNGVLEDGKTPVRLIQHVSQISFLLTSLPKKDPTKPKQPFGFAANVPQPTDQHTDN
jgi:hypothetical protein